MEELIKIANNGQWSLSKGSMKRIAPIKERSNPDKSASNWISTANPKDRENIKELSGPHRVRGLNRLGGKTKVRTNPETNKREFLLHRGMSGDEAGSHKKGEVDTKTSWTPHLDNASAFVKWQDDAHEGDYVPHHLASAWISEDHIHAIPLASGDHLENDKTKQTAQEEHEIIVNPHKFNFHKAKE